MINKALRLIRVYHDLNQADAAERVGLSRSYVSEIESGNKKVTLEVLERYSKAFDIPMSSLLLFAERLDEGRFTDNAHRYVTEKALKMLEWIAMISSEKKTDTHG